MPLCVVLVNIANSDSKIHKCRQATLGPYTWKSMTCANADQKQPRGLVSQPSNRPLPQPDWHAWGLAATAG